MQFGNEVIYELIPASAPAKTVPRNLSIRPCRIACNSVSTRFSVAAIRGEMELLEREQFFGELEAILSDVATGKGRFVLVSGEAGIGKTSFVERFAETHKKQARV